VAPERFRFDFTHFTALKGEELRSVEEMVNEKIMDNRPVEAAVLDIREALALGAIALFGEKYGEEVRIISIPDTSRELCGGTHVGATGDIGLFTIVSEGSVASGIRRIEGLTGKGAMARIEEQRRELEEIGLMLKAPEHPAERVALLLEEVKALRRETERLKGAAARDVSREIAEGARTLDGLKVVSLKVEGLDPRELRALADSVRDRLGSGIIVLASAKDGQATLLAMVTKDLTARFNAGEILKAVASAAGGRGGGKEDMAQGGTKDLERLDSALQTVYDIVRGSKGSS
jgi:alanyl-tRNA synthetase